MAGPVPASGVPPALKFPDLVDTSDPSTEIRGREVPNEAERRSEDEDCRAGAHCTPWRAAIPARAPLGTFVADVTTHVNGLGQGPGLGVPGALIGSPTDRV